MSSKPNSFNPFYPLLVVAGIVFCITACAYGVMTVRKLRNPLEENPPAFIQWMDEQGMPVMMGELVGLAVLTFAAIGADSYWTSRNEQQAKPDHLSSQTPETPPTETPPTETSPPSSDSGNPPAP